MVHALPGVGENLQDHLQLRVIFRCTKPITTNDTLKSWWRKMAMGARYVATRTGPMAIGINQGGMFARTDPALPRPDVQFHLATLSSDMAGSPVHTFSGFTMSVCQLQSRVARAHRGRSRADPLAAPSIHPNYLATPRDRATVVAGIRLARRLAATRALSPYVAGEYRPGPEAVTDDDLLEFARNQGATIFHPAGTCKMGPASDPLAVVDPALRVHGVEALRVVDCSVMPTLVSGNTNAPVVMIAEKAADMIAARFHVEVTTMSCCHADFALVEGSDRGFTVGMPTFTFGAGVLAEAGDNARELGLKRVALFTDARLRPGPYVATVLASLARRGRRRRGLRRGRRSSRPTPRSRHATRFAAEGRFDGYVSVGGGSVIDTCKAANLYATHPAEFMTYVNAPIGAGQKVPGAVLPHIACPTTSGTGSETTGISIFNLSLDQRQDRHHLAPPDSDGGADRPRRHRVAAEERRGRDRLRLHEPRAGVDHRARLSAPRQPGPGHRPAGVAGGQRVLGHARHRGADERRQVPGARGQRRVRHRGAHRDDVRGDAGRHRVQRRRLPPAARTVLRGVRAGQELARARLPRRQVAGPARDGGRAQQPVGVAVHGALLPRAPPARRALPRRAHRRRAVRGRRRRAGGARDRADARDGHAERT